jgi:4-amino-4-deoxy-L-arabinose transferase-like glycosyltransferase
VTQSTVATIRDRWSGGQFARAAVVASFLAAGLAVHAITTLRSELVGLIWAVVAIASTVAAALLASPPPAPVKSNVSEPRWTVSPRSMLIVGGMLTHGSGLALVYIDSSRWILASILIVASLLLIGVALAWNPPPLRVDGWVSRVGIRTTTVDWTSRRVESASVLALVAMGSGLRLWDLENLPLGAHRDEGDLGTEVLSILAGSGPPVFGSMGIGDPALYAYLVAPLVALFGTTMFALRLFQAVAGALGLLAMYGLMRSMFGGGIALSTLSLLVISIPHIHFSRIAFNFIQVPLIAAAAFWCLWIALGRDRHSWWWLTGACAASAYFFHYSGRLVLPMIGAVLVLCLVADPRRWRSWLGRAGMLMLGAAMVLSPVAVHMSTRLHELTRHVSDRIIWNQWPRLIEQHKTDDPIMILLAQLKANILGFVIRPDNGVFMNWLGTPLLPAALVPLVLVGTVLGLTRIRDVRFAILSTWFWTILIFGGALTFDPPQFHRIYPALPPAMALSVLAMVWWLNAWRSWEVRIAPVLIMVGVIAWTGVRDWNAYVRTSNERSPWVEASAAGRFFASIDPTYRAFVLGRPWVYADFGVIQYLGGVRRAANLDNPALELPVDQPVAVVVHPQLVHYGPALQATYQSGRLSAHRERAGRLVQFEFVAPQGVTSTYDGGGLRLRIESPTREPIGQSRVVAFVGHRLLTALVPRETRQFRASWSGQLVPTVPGDYRVEVNADGAATLRLGGRDVLDSPARGGNPGLSATTVRLDAVSVPIELEYQYGSGAGVVELIWSPPGAERSIIPSTALRPN